MCTVFAEFCVVSMREDSRHCIVCLVIQLLRRFYDFNHSSLRAVIKYVAMESQSTRK